MKKTIFAILFLLLVLSCAPINAHGAAAGAGMVETAGGRLHVRAKPSVNGSVVTTLAPGGYVTIHGSTGDWYYVEFSRDRFGYCHEDYIRKISGNVSFVSTKGSNLNVRTGPGTHYAIRSALPVGQAVTVLDAQSGWSRIVYHGGSVGYVSSTYLSGSTLYAPIRLEVPSYKQTDSRWAHSQIGTSGKTMANIGCATTAIAMMESYRTGSAITPDAMAKRLSYTSSGNVYWPSHYRVTTDDTSYLQKIYDLLQQGKPVLFGARNAAGGQHWVVITGFSGRDLTPDSFSVLDPGSASRTDLQQFLNVYPVFYKYFTY